MLHSDLRVGDVLANSDGDSVLLIVGEAGSPTGYGYVELMGGGEPLWAPFVQKGLPVNSDYSLLNR